jgi:hypothetical protein
MRPSSFILRVGGLGLFSTLLCLGSSAGQTDSGSARRNDADRRDLALVRVTPAPLLVDGASAARRPQAPPPGAQSKRDLAQPKRRPGKMGVSLDVLVEGRPLRTVTHEGKTYLPVSRVGAEYTLRVWNHGPRRIAAVLSVDGLSVISGQPASANQPGYIVAPYSHVVIDGWRRSMDAVAAFRFVDRDSSYAAKTGRPENIGVLGLIAIEEQVWPPSPALEKRDAKAPGALFGRAQAGSIGTEYGREVDSRVYYVPFTRSTNRQAITYYYDTMAALRSAGVPVDDPAPVPFPADPPFAPPPPGYKGK